MNCFLCHSSAPNNEARIAALEAGKFAWANTATLLGTGIVEAQGEGYRWNLEAFDSEGELRDDQNFIQDPTNENCGLCHGLVHDELEEPLALSGCVPDRYRTVTTGQIISPQRMKDSGMNLADKESLSRSWDIHAERLVDCTDCHYSLNNPVYYQESASTRPEHLRFDPRRLELGDYLYRPVHDFARGISAQSTLAPELKETMRRCDSCHRVETTHDWLPYKDRHMQELSCESCHIPKIYANAMRQNDWTVLSLEGDPNRECRGVDGDGESVSTLVTGYDPVLLNREDLDGNNQLAPYNLISSWYWVYGDPPQPVRYYDLQSVWFEDGQYRQEVVDLFDIDRDGALSDLELRIDTPEKEVLIQAELASLGLENPRIHGDVQPFNIHHAVATDEWVVRDCQTCHSDAGRIDQPIQLASYIPGGVLPDVVQVAGTDVEGELKIEEDGSLYFNPTPGEGELYVFGRDNVDWIDSLGAFLFLGTLIGIGGHATFRLIASMRQPSPEPEVESVYMYSVYERLWHWLQTAVILLLLFTGLIIHAPDTFGVFSFDGVVVVHNVLAAILLINAGFALFYHLASGEIRQYLPRPSGFFDRAIVQVKFYVQGIFKGEEHPFEKTPERKLNPLQQVTYFMILNLLLPLQVITGILMWGVQRWPQVAQTAGGLPLLAPFHTLIAWLFASFIVLHVYLTTTGPTPTTSIKAMIMGWDEVEVHPSSGKEVAS
jgi:thiosulfate reductase cytochrome b subunit